MTLAKVVLIEGYSEVGDLDLCRNPGQSEAELSEAKLGKRRPGLVVIDAAVSERCLVVESEYSTRVRAKST